MRCFCSPTSQSSFLMARVYLMLSLICRQLVTSGRPGACAESRGVCGPVLPAGARVGAAGETPAGDDLVPVGRRARALVLSRRAAAPSNRRATIVCVKS